MKRKLMVIVTVLLIGLSAWFAHGTNPKEWPNERLRGAVAGRSVDDVKCVVVYGPKNIKVTDPAQIKLWLHGLQKAQWPGDPEKQENQPGNQMFSVAVFFNDGTDSGMWGFGTDSPRDCFSQECRKAFNMIPWEFKIPTISQNYK